ncbi:MAG: hypothetical protein ACI4BI_04650 [Anaerotardibacter sp.]
MASIGYFGKYARFTTVDKKEAGAFMGPDNIVGDYYTIQDTYTDGERQTWIVNEWDIKMGLLDEKIAEEIDLNTAKGLETVAILSYVAYSQVKEEGIYWGEVAIISYDPQYEKAFKHFLEKLRRKIASGVRPDLNLGEKALKELIAKNGNYLPSGRVAYPALGKGEAFVKKERTTTEILVNQAREGNKGCYFLSYAFLFVVFAVIAYFVYTSGVLNFLFN